MGDPTGLTSKFVGKVFDTAVDYVRTANRYNSRHEDLEDLVHTTGAFLQACPSVIDRRIVQRAFEDVQPLHKGAQQLMRERQAWEDKTTTFDRHLRLHTRWKLSKDALDRTQKIRTTEADRLPRAILVSVLDLQKELKALRNDVRDIKSSLGPSGACKQASPGQETETPQQETRKPKTRKPKKRKPKKRKPKKCKPRTNKQEKDGEAAGTGMNSARADCMTSFARGVRSIQERFIEAIKEGGREACFDVIDGAMQQVVNMHLESIRSAQISQRWPSSSVTCESWGSPITVKSVYQVQDGIDLKNVVLPESREAEHFEAEEIELADVVGLEEEGHKTQLVEVECSEQLYGPASSQYISREISYGKTGNFTLEALEIATNNFASVIGSGGFGRVYMGYLPDGSRIAVKVSYNDANRSGRYEEAFWQEVACSFEHPALVKMLGWCVPAKSRRETFFFFKKFKKENAGRRGRYIVMEYLEGGSLHDQLFGGIGRDLEWPVRLNICKNAAGGISFLHKQGIIHRDIKPGNILLDENCSPKIIDFGISRSLPSETLHTTSGIRSAGATDIIDPTLMESFMVSKLRSDLEFVSTTVTGTHGYIDPEYMQTGRVSPKSDVFSFGVTLLNVLSGSDAFDIENYLYVRAKMLCLESRFRELIDPRMDSTVRDVNDFEEILQVLCIALRCCSPHSESRPTIDEVHSMLLKVGSERLQTVV